MSKEKILETLTDLGFKKTEAKVYFYLAKKGPKKAKEIVEAVGIVKQRLYPILKNLQRKGVINCSLQRPSSFSAISYEKLLDLFARTKIEEAKILEQNKGKLISDWESIQHQNNNFQSIFFTVIEGRKYVYSKIQQMIQDCKKNFSVILTVSDLFYAEQCGVLDIIQKHSNKDKINFRIITEIPKNYLQAIKKLLETKSAQIKVKGTNSDLGLSLAPRMIIRDNEEILYFISTEMDDITEQGFKDALFTNCSSLIEPLSNVFDDLWINSTDIKQKIIQIEKGETVHKANMIKDEDVAQNKLDNVLRKAGDEILFVTSSEGLISLQKDIPSIKNNLRKNVSIRIMAPIVTDNFNAYTELVDYCQVRHISQNFLNIVIIDGKHLFQFNKSRSNGTEIKSLQKISNTVYTNDLKHIKNSKMMLESLWKNSSTPSKSPVASMVNSLDKFSFSTDSVSNKPSSKKLAKYFQQKPAISRSESAPGEIFEKDVLDKILSPKKPSDSSKEIIHTYCRLGYAVINPPEKFNLPNMLINTIQIDKKSFFGAEDRIVFHLWKETEKGFRYVPVAIIGDNPQSLKILNKGEYHNTPAVKNFHLVDKKVIQFQLYGNIFLATWTIPIPLIPGKLTLSPGTIILETYGSVKPKKTLARYPLGQEYEMYCNGFDSFVTFMYDSSRYTGSGTDGFFLRDAYVGITIP
ncbi:MAG: hypothetical protein JW870_06860 [Candidatus Delongbacteria bacterium]|nr:hypothetical protein [Candidatus Delongbacteria bacterium]